MLAGNQPALCVSRGSLSYRSDGCQASRSLSAQTRYPCCLTVSSASAGPSPVRTRVRSDPADGEALIAAWRTNHRVTTYLIENLPAELWSKDVPGAPRRTVRTIAAHIHNARCMWIKMMGARHGIEVPRTVDGRLVRPAELSRALSRSSEGIIALIRLGAARGGAVPPAAWQNFPDGSRALPDLFRGTRGSPSGAAVPAGTSIGAPPARSCDGRAVAVEAASARMTLTPTQAPVLAIDA